MTDETPASKAGIALPRVERWSRLGVPVDAVDLDGAVDFLGTMLEHGIGGWVATPNPDIVYAAWHNREFAVALRGASLSVADGIGVVWASRILHGPVRTRVTGVELVTAALKLCARRGLPVFLLGGMPGVAAGAARNAAALWPGLQVTGTHHGYFDKAQAPAVLAEILRAAPRFVVAGMGHPKQELWLAANMPSLPGSVGIACGGTLDVLAGVVRRAPGWARRANIEWLYRLFSAPVARGRRAWALPAFAARVLAMRLGLRTAEIRAKHNPAKQGRE